MLDIHLAGRLVACDDQRVFGRCPCGSARPLSVCCGRFHAGAEPPDAPALMRSRWSAFAVGDFAYLWRTLHADHPDRADTFETFLARAEADAAGRRYRKLLVLASSGPDAEGYAHVLFHADITHDRAKRSFAEHSRFAHDGTGWRYLDGVVLLDRDLPRPIEALTFDSFHLAARR